MKFWKEGMLVCGMLYSVCLLVMTGFLGQDAQMASAVIEQKEAPKIAITFDDGPSMYTEELLDGLKERNVKATFFVIGKNAAAYPKLLKREDQEGHLVGNHTYNHVEISKISDEKAREELEKTNAVLRKILGKETEYVRPPFGVWQKKLEREMDAIPVLWSVDPLDWTTKNVDEIVEKVVTKTKENDIILLHDCYKSSVQATFRIIDILQKEGYEFVTVDELLFN